MNRERLSLVGHSTLDIMSPVPRAGLERLFDLAAIVPGDTAADIGAGKGSIALLALVRGARVTLVERSPLFADRAREAVAHAGFSAAAEVIEDDAVAFSARVGEGRFQLAICIGASHALGGRDSALSALSRLLAPEGHALFGEGFWRKRPSPDYLTALGAREDDFGTRAQNTAAATARGLVLIAEEIAEGEGFDAYELGWCSSIERHAGEHPSDPDAAEMLAIAASRRQLYERFGRDELGFSVQLLQKRPPPAAGGNLAGVAETNS